MKNNMKTFSALWAGTQESFDAYCSAHMESSSYVKEQHAIVQDDEDNYPELFSLDNGVGIITIHGTLTNEDNWWNKWAGLVSYNEIREAVYYAVASNQVKEILLDVSSPGGSVFGVMDAAQAIANAASLKPVVAFSDSVVASGGYWLIAPATEKYISKVATAGSIGVIYVHREFSKAAEEAGYTYTVFRSGKFKALGHQ